MKILYILIFSVLFFDPSHCQDALNGKDDEEGKEVYSATSDLVKDDSLHHPRSTRSLLLSEKLDSLRDKRILTKKNKLTDFLPSESLSFLSFWFYNLLLTIGGLGTSLCFEQKAF